MKLTNSNTTLDQIANAIQYKIESVKNDFMALGELFYEARKRLPGDLEFGRWCDDNGFEVPQQTRWKLMKVYERFGLHAQEARPLLGWTVLVELADVPDADAAIAAGVKRDEAKDIKKAGSFEAWTEARKAEQEQAAETVINNVVPNPDPPMPKRRTETTLDDLQQRAFDENPGLKEEIIDRDKAIDFILMVWRPDRFHKLDEETHTKAYELLVKALDINP
jgi:hypothetical protein